MYTRRSTAAHRNPGITKARPSPTPDNRAWLAERAKVGSVIFIGGAKLDDFRIRYAQSRFRHDLLPSFWSWVGIADGRQAMYTVPLGFGTDASVPVARNGIVRVPLARFSDTAQYPNVGVVSFVRDGRPIVSNARRLVGQRSAIDLPALMLPWLAYVWGAPTQDNPATAGHGVPSAVFTQAAFGMAGIELTPGMSTNASCPEAIWQSALWWHRYYKQTADVAGPAQAHDPSARDADDPGQIVPVGEYRVLQPAAAVSMESK